MPSSLTILSPPHQPDKISELPDDILLKILSTFDLKNVVRTSIFAKRWRYLWTWLTNLDFDPEILLPVTYDKMEPQVYEDLVNQVIDAHQGPFIRKFIVIFSSSHRLRPVCQIEKWARFAFSKRVEELDLKLYYFNSHPRFSLGFDILKQHPRNSGIVNLKSLRLSNVDVTAETLEFILLHSNLLELLHVSCSHTLHTLSIVSYKLKHLTLAYCFNLKKLYIDAVNLISFQFSESYNHDNRCLRMVCKNVPKLVEVGLKGNLRLYPFSVMGHISYLSKQLTKLSFYLHVFCDDDGFGIPVKIGVLFPNVKKLTLNVSEFIWRSISYMEHIINACPMLQELQLLVDWDHVNLRVEAKKLQEIELEDEIFEEMWIDPSSYYEHRPAYMVNYMEGKKYENNKSLPNLKVLEVVAFRGCDADVNWVLHIIACANSLEAVICDPRIVVDFEARWEFKDIMKTESVKRRARKLAKLLPPNVHVGFWNKPGLVWIS